jgi:predicted amidohydrolase YtcJ
MSPYADLLIINAHVYTVDDANPWAEAVALVGSRIAFVGGTAAAQAWRGPKTRLIDGRGCSLLPGFIDSHFHLLWGALGLADMQLDGVRLLADLATAVAAYRQEKPQTAWLVGRGLRYVVPDPQTPLTRHHLDAIEAERPFIITAYDYHTMWANTVALRQAGLLQGGPTPPGSQIIMGSDGLASGELREPAAYNPILALRPEPDDIEKMRLTRQALALCASLGLTSLHNMDGGQAQAQLYAALEDQGALTLRVYLPYDVTPETAVAALSTEAVALRDNFQSELLRGGMVKFFMDGVLEAYTGFLIDPYTDQPATRGEPLFTAEQFNSLAVAADRLGLQIAVHACGDGAVRQALDGLALARETNGRANGGGDRRHRIEHIELIHPDDIPRFAQLGVTAAMQPLHSPRPHLDGDVWPSRVGAERWPRSFAWRSLRQAGARLVFGSDWPVVSPNPMAGIEAALNRRPWGDEGDAHFRLTLAEIIASYTREAAYAEFQEGQKGQIKVGLLADLVLLSANIWELPPESIGEVEPLLTICNGRVVYDR